MRKKEQKKRTNYGSLILISLVFPILWCGIPVVRPATFGESAEKKKKKFVVIIFTKHMQAPTHLQPLKLRFFLFCATFFFSLNSLFGNMNYGTTFSTSDENRKYVEIVSRLEYFFFLFTLILISSFLRFLDIFYLRRTHPCICIHSFWFSIHTYEVLFFNRTKDELWGDYVQVNWVSRITVFNNNNEKKRNVFHLIFTHLIRLMLLMSSTNNFNTLTKWNARVDRKAKYSKKKRNWIQ